MIRRWLRGPWLYIALIVLLAVLYAPILHMQALPPLQGQEATPAPQHLEWWPKQLDAPAIQHVVEQEPWLMIWLSLLGTLMVGFGLCGLCLTVWSLGPGRLSAAQVRMYRVPPWSFGDLGRIAALTMIAAGLLPFARVALIAFQLSEPPDAHVWLTSSMLWLDAFVILTILAFAAGKRAAFGRSIRHPSVMLFDAFRSYLTAFPWLFIILFLIVEVVRMYGWTPPYEPIQELIFGEQRPWVLALTMLLACVVGPVAEEMFFRGVLYGAIRYRASRRTAMLTSAAAFAALHANPVGFFPIMALGLLLVHVYERTGSLLASIFIHIVHNTILMSFALLLRGLLTYA